MSLHVCVFIYTWIKDGYKRWIMANTFRCDFACVSI